MKLDYLNTQQRQIVINGDGIIIVKAGPGTGKTKTLISRVAYLIADKNIPPQKILVLTFTKRAASEMKDRLKNLLTKNTLPSVTTFHGFCYDLLMGLDGNVNLISEEEREKLIKEVIKKSGVKISGRDLSQLISRQKSTPFPDKPALEFTRLIDKYNSELSAKGTLDFDDLLMRTYHLLMKDASLRIKTRQQYQYVLIDEFQDTNDLQYQITRMILTPHPNLFVIGDPYQSIYGFRGAQATIFQKLRDDFSGVREETLTTNYRSRETIVSLSNRLFSTKLEAFRSEDGRAVLLETPNEFSEADWIINFINQRVGGIDLLQPGENDQTTFADFAVIYRTHRLANILEKKFSRSGMPYQVVKEDTPTKGDHIKLLSMHAAKGLEFKYVFLCGFEEGFIPYLKEARDLEEEKRLFYVAMTRAKEELYLIHARKRNGGKARLSSFAQHIEHPCLQKWRDDQTEKIKRTAQLKKLKKSQMTLF